MKRYVVPLLLAVTACGGGEERLALRAGEPAEDLYVHSPGAPKVRFAAATKEAVRLPAPADEGDFLVASLPVGFEEEGRPGLLVVIDDAGALVESRMWIDREGGGDFTGAEAIPLAPYEEYEGWYTWGPLEVSVPLGPDRPGTRTARFRGLLNVYAGGARLRVDPAETRLGRFPNGGPAFLLYDGDRNGLYGGADRLVIDANGDGVFDGNRNSVELYAIGEPFLLGGEARVLASIAPDGSSVALASSRVSVEPRIPLLPGDVAPDFALNDLSGAPVRFAEAAAGRPVLLAYWATW